MLQLLYFLSLISTIFPEKPIWDGKKHDGIIRHQFTDYRFSKKFHVELKRKNFLNQTINIFKHIDIINVPIHEVDISFVQVNSHGVRFLHKNENEYKQTITTWRSENEHLTGADETSCHLTHCE
ncbi:Hypothetical protein SRAE_0000077400, partial [Strongyloides ratti]